MPNTRHPTLNTPRPTTTPLTPTSSTSSTYTCSFEQAYEWTDGKVVFASGSPFEPIEVDGKTLTPSQCNNMFIFPGTFSYI